ncbi:hypothetical protein Tco_1301784 [Tanacetum coccineum]
MIGSLMYLIASGPDLVFAVCMCARYQSKPTKKHLEAVKWVFWYLQESINMGLWYSKDTTMALTAYADADHAGCQDTRRSTSGSAQFLDTMTDAVHAPAMAPPVRTDEQILPRNRWVPIGKSNCYLNEEKSQPNPIFKIAVDILKQTNFFRAFTASSTIPAIYIQQFWDTICFDSKAGSYKCQLDEQWFNLTQDTLRDALQITPVDNNQAFSSPPTPDTLVEFVNKLGYPKEVIHLSNVTTNDMFQPWRALQHYARHWFLTGKASDLKGREPQCYKSFGVLSIKLTSTMLKGCGKNLLNPSTPSQKTKGSWHNTLWGRRKQLLSLSQVSGHLKFSAKGSKREVFGMTIPNELINNVIRGADYYDAYLEKVAKHQRYIAGEELSDPESPAPKPAKPIKQAKPKATEQPTVSKTKAKKSKPAPAKPKEKKRKPVSESSEAQPLAKRAKAGKVVKKRTVKSSKQLVDEFVDEGVPAAKPSLEDTEEAILQKVLEESLTDAYPTQRGPLPPVVFRETDTGKFQPLPEVPGKGKEKVGEEQAAQVLLNLQTPKKKSSAEQYIFQRRSHVPTKTAGREDSTSLYAELGLYAVNESYKKCHYFLEWLEVGIKMKARLDQTLVIPEEPVSSTGTLSSLQHLAKDFSFGDQFLNDKPSEADNEKTTADTEAESMVSVTIQQDTSIIPPMTSPVIDLVTRPDSPNVHWPLPTTTTTTAAPPPTTTTITLPLPPQPQQGPTDPILIKRMGELEEFIANLVEENQAFGNRLKAGSRSLSLETMDLTKMIREQTVEFINSQDIDRKINETVKEVVISPNYDKGHANHRVAYEALQDSIRCDKIEDFDVDKAQEETKKKSKQDSPNTPPGSPPSPPPPPPPPTGASGASGTTGASDSAQAPPLPPPSSSTHQGGQSTSTVAPSSSKTATLAEYSAWTTTDTRIKPSVTTIPDDLYMDDETTADEQANSSDDKVGRDHENSLLAQTGDMATFMDWYCKQRGISELTPIDLNACNSNRQCVHHDVIHLQFQREVVPQTSSPNKCMDAILNTSVSKPLPWRPAFISKIKAAYYPDVGLEQLVPDQFWIEEEYKYDIAAIHTEDKTILTTAVHLWTAETLDYQHRLEDFQLELKLPEQLNSTKPRWEATGFEFKHDYTVIDSPRAVTFRDRYGVQMIMRFNEIHKYSDGTLQQIDEALDYRVKEFQINRTNPGINTDLDEEECLQKQRTSSSAI